jgi:hypothetical protein
MTKLEQILKRAQSLTSTIANGEKITEETKSIATELDGELNELIGWFDKNWMSYEQGYEYDPELIDIALQMGATE